MKKTFQTIIIITTVLFLNGCESFLDKQPLDQLASETFWQSQDDAEMALNACYGKLRSSLMSWDLTTLDGMSDDLYHQHGHYGVTSLAQGNIEPTSGGLVSDIFSYAYSGISTCHFFLGNIDRVDMDETIKNQYIAEVRFLRAHFYFYLSEFYGGVPLYLSSPTTEEAATTAKSTKEQVVTAIIDDLDFAIANLPDIAYNGHAVKGSAYALKARVLLHNERWEEAASAANNVISNSNFGLSSEYMDIWDRDKQEGNPEILFSVKYLNPNLAQPFYGADIVYNWWHSTAPVHYIIDTYECTDGKNISESPLYDQEHPYDNRDPRLRWCNYVDMDPWYYGQDVLGDGVKRWRPGFTGGDAAPATPFLLKKFQNTSYLPYSYSVKTDYDAVLLRYAEVLLIYAEAKNEASTTPDETIYKAVNDVRARVEMPDLPTGLSKEQMRERIRHERRIELAYEGKRYMDLKRWKTAHIVIPTIVDPGGKVRKFENPKHYLFPFPQSEIDINKNLEQNPDYN
ncbi:RagB/SusD family nutrient uptake outer membrane protein [Maribellus luteus]|nr:RagB/SusD family nutrient uptake outer membrane protein [Maribellus luteus]